MLAIFSQSGKKIRKAPEGIRKIFLGADCRVLPIWTEGGEEFFPNKGQYPKIRFPFPRIWRKVIIKIGEPFEVKDLKKDEIVPCLENALLNLADE